jgi:hypothetical protein
LLEYLAAQFGPYPDRKLHIVEFSRYGGFGHAGPHTIAFAENACFSLRRAARRHARLAAMSETEVPMDDFVEIGVFTGGPPYQHRPQPRFRRARRSAASAARVGELADRPAVR